MPTIQEFSGKKYKVENGTFYHEETADEIIAIIETARIEHQILRFHWGDTKTGKDWGDVNDVNGRVSRSMGPVKVPLLMEKTGDMGGTGILDHCIVKITRHSGKKVLYQHPMYHD
jgi:hypothetical protein